MTGAATSRVEPLRSGRLRRRVSSPTYWACVPCPSARSSRGGEAVGTMAWGKRVPLILGGLIVIVMSLNACGGGEPRKNRPRRNPCRRSPGKSLQTNPLERSPTSNPMLARNTLASGTSRDHGTPHGFPSVLVAVLRNLLCGHLMGRGDVGHREPRTKRVVHDHEAGVHGRCRLRRCGRRDRCHERACPLPRVD
jgi:hypothetical protein